MLIAVIVMLAAASRYGNVLDYAGPNLSSNQIALHANTPPPAGSILVGPNGRTRVAPRPTAKLATPAQLAAGAKEIAGGLSARLVPLESTNAELVGTQGGRSWSGADLRGDASPATGVRDQRLRNRSERGWS